MARYNFNRADSIQDRVNAYLSQSANRAFNDRTAAINRTLESRYSNWTDNPRGTSLDRRTVQPSRVNRRRPTRKYKNVVKPTNTDGEEYTIKAGDTLSGILKAKGINADWRAVAKANGIADGNRIIAGQKIKLPSVNKSNSNGSAQPEANKPALPANKAAANNNGASARRPAANNTQRRESAPQRTDNVAQRNNVVSADTLRNNNAAPAAPAANSTRRDSVRRDTVAQRRAVQNRNSANNATTAAVPQERTGSRFNPGNYVTSGAVRSMLPNLYGIQDEERRRRASAAFGEEPLRMVSPEYDLLGGGMRRIAVGSVKRGADLLRQPKLANAAARTVGDGARQMFSRGRQFAQNTWNAVKRYVSADPEALDRASRIARIRRARAASTGTSNIGGRLSQLRGRVSDIWGNVKQRVRNWFPESGAENVRVSEEVGQRTVRDTRPFRRKVSDWRERLRTDKKAGYDVAPKPRNTPRSRGDNYAELRRQFGKDRAIRSTREGRTFEAERGEVSRAWKPKNAIDRINRNAAARSSAPKPAAKPAPKTEPMVEAKPEPKAEPKKPSTGGRKSSSEHRAERAARGSRKRK